MSFENTERKSKVYCGSGWELTNQWGTINNIEIEVSKLPEPDQFGKVYLTISRRKELGKHKQTHAIYINEYRMNQKKEMKPKESSNNFYDDNPSESF